MESALDSSDTTPGNNKTELVIVHYLRSKKYSKSSSENVIQLNTNPVHYEIPSPPPIEKFLESLGDSSWTSNTSNIEDINQINQLHSSSKLLTNLQNNRKIK